VAQSGFRVLPYRFDGPFDAGKVRDIFRLSGVQAQSLFPSLSRGRPGHWREELLQSRERALYYDIFFRPLHWRLLSNFPFWQSGSLFHLSGRGGFPRHLERRLGESGAGLCGRLVRLRSILFQTGQEGYRDGFPRPSLRLGMRQGKKEKEV